MIPDNNGHTAQQLPASQSLTWRSIRTTLAALVHKHGGNAVTDKRVKVIGEHIVVEARTSVQH